MFIRGRGQDHRDVTMGTAGAGRVGGTGEGGQGSGVNLLSEFFLPPRDGDQFRFSREDGHVRDLELVEVVVVWLVRV